jgi:multicomponent Na+:H+ antiporter subunit D
MIEVFLGLIPLIPAFGAFTIPVVYLASRNRLLVMSVGATSTFISLVISALLTISAFSSNEPLVFKAGGWAAPIGILYVADKFTSTLSLVTCFIGLLIFLYSVSYITDDNYPWYTALLLGAISGILGILLTGDLFNLFVMLEVTSVSSYGLVMYYRRRADSILSGLKYAFIGALGTTLYLLAMGLVYSVYGTLNMVDLSVRITTTAITPQVVQVFSVVMVLALWAFSIKSGVFPNHFWLPDAHPAAPTPISALLSGLVVNTGVVALYKLLYLATGSLISQPLPHPLGDIRSIISLMATCMGALSAIIGALLMYIQRDVKRLIAYSTIMNLGYLFMAVGCGTQRSVEAALLYTSIHSIAKATLFLSAGIFIRAAKSRDLQKLAGSWRASRAGAIALAVSILTLAGVPPLPGFMAKLMLFDALFEYWLPLAVLMIIASAIGLVSYMKLFYTILLAPPVSSTRSVDMKLAKLALIILVATILVAGVLFIAMPQELFTLLRKTSEQSIQIQLYREAVFS